VLADGFLNHIKKTLYMTKSLSYISYSSLDFSWIDKIL